MLHISTNKSKIIVIFFCIAKDAVKNRDVLSIHRLLDPLYTNGLFLPV